MKGVMLYVSTIDTNMGVDVIFCHQLSFCLSLFVFIRISKGKIHLNLETLGFHLSCWEYNIYISNSIKMKKKMNIAYCSHPSWEGGDIFPRIFIDDF